MEIHQLRYFVAVAEEGSFSRAAAKVRVAQPSLSQQIRKLEAEVGQPLFDRLPRSVVLTEEHPLAKKDLVEFDDLKSQRFLLLHEMHCLSQQVNHLLESRRLRPEIALAGSQLSTIANMVAASIGVSIVPQMMVKHHATPGCVSLPFAPPIPERELNLVYNPLRFQSKAAAAFRREAAAALSAKNLTVTPSAT